MLEDRNWKLGLSADQNTKLFAGKEEGQYSFPNLYTADDSYACLLWQVDVVTSSTPYQFFLIIIL